MSERDLFKGKTAFITGATRGIGKCIALELARLGCNVVVTGKTAEPNPKLPGTIIETVDAINAAGGSAMGQQLDVRDDEAVRAALGKAASVYGGIDFLINNASAIHIDGIGRTPLKKFDLMMSVNARATYACIHHALPHLKQRPGGHVITMSPPLDTEGIAGKPAYALSKYGMTMVTLGAAAELAGCGVAANCLWPATMIESAATVNNGFGTPHMWRKPDIVVDCVVRVLQKEPATFTGRTLIDEDFLRAEGVTDFARYRCDPDHEPPRIGFDFKPAPRR